MMIAHNPLHRFSFNYFTKSFLAVSLLLSTTACNHAESSLNTPVKNAQTPASPRFPFPVPASGNQPGSLVDLSALNPAPLTNAHRLVAKQGHYFDTTGRRVRFLALSMGAAELFPDHAEADKIAKRLHLAGINMVRLHHLDATWGTPNIFYFEGGNTQKKPMVTIDQRSLERFDYLVAQFKKNGIYVDLNLHIVRPWNAAMGFPDADKINAEGKVVSYFEPKAIAYQKQYARDILTHVNRYTGQRYADDPVVAIVEITNEDTLLGAADGITTLPPHYQEILKTGWNRFLKQKYGETSALKTAWSGDATPLGKEILLNGKFAAGIEGWTLEHQSTSEATLSAESAAGQTNAPEGKILHVSGIKLSGESWHLQLHATGLDLKEGAKYTVSFAAKASAPRKMWLNTRTDRAPWSFIGLDQSFPLDTQWKRYSFSFVAHNPDPNHNRVSFTFGDATTDFFIGDVSLRPGGGGSSLPENQSLEAGNIDLGTISATPSGADFVAYLIATERSFADGMRDLIKKDLGFKSTVFCSQASYGGLGGTWREANMDAVDMHAYWQHPSFPGSAFDPNNYRTENSSMVKQSGLGTLDGLANHRVAGKPFTVSEYNHPAPNEYAAESLPMIFSYAAWQDWDGIFLFAYGGSPQGKISGFFDATNNPAIMAFLPTAANLFLRGDVRPAPQTMTLTIPISQIPKLKSEGGDYAFYTYPGPLPTNASFWTERAAIEFTDKPNAKPRITVKGDTPQLPPLAWDHTQGVYTINTPETRCILGFVGGKTTTIAGLTLTMQPTERNFAVLSVTSRDGLILEQSKSLLLTVMDKAENPGAQWDAERRFAAHAWENGPVEVEGITGTVTLPTRAKSATVYTLDNTGKRLQAVPAQVANGKLTLAISPQQKTLWYEISLVF